MSPLSHIAFGHACHSLQDRDPLQQTNTPAPNGTSQLSAECFGARFAVCNPTAPSAATVPQPGLTLGIPPAAGRPRPTRTRGRELLGKQGCPPPSIPPTISPPWNIFTTFSRAPPPALFPAAAERHLDRAELIASILSTHPRWLTEGLGSRPEPQAPPRSFGGCSSGWGSREGSQPRPRGAEGKSN